MFTVRIGIRAQWRSSHMEEFQVENSGRIYLRVIVYGGYWGCKRRYTVEEFVDDLGVILRIKDPLEIFCDNEGAVTLTKDPKDHGNSKHILRKFHYVEHRVEDGDIYGEQSVVKGKSNWSVHEAIMKDQAR